MKCTIPGRHIRMIGRAMHALARIGDDLYIDPQPDGVAFRTLNSSRSAFISFLFYERFFDEYVEKVPESLNSTQDSHNSSQNPSKCRVSIKAINMVFRSISVLDKTVGACSIISLPHEEKVKIGLHCKYSVKKLYTIPYIESETLTSDVDLAQVKNTFTCQSKVLNEAALNFLRNQEEITMISSSDKFIIKTFLEVEEEEDKGVRTEYSLPPFDFEAYSVEIETSITYCLKELRALISFADAFTLPLNANYGKGGDPIVFSVESPEVVKAGLVMATLASESIPQKQDKNKKKHSNNKTVINNSTSNNTSNTSFRDTDDLRYVIRQPMIWNDVQPEPIEPEIEGNGDVVEMSQLERSPPSKRARFFFKRCFEATFNPESIPGSSKILAPDSDEENN